MKTLRVSVATALMALAACGSTGQPKAATQLDDGGTSPGSDPNDNGVIAKVTRTDWMSVKGNQFIDSKGTVWMGRGVTIHDTRSCDFCTSHPALVAEVKRRVDEAVDNWHVNYFRLLLQSFAAGAYGDATGNTRVQWQTFLQDPNYLHDIQEIVEYIGTKPNVFVLVTPWKDPSFTPTPTGDSANAASTTQGGLPTADTYAELAKLAEVFANDAHVMFSVSNEPELNQDGLQDAQCQSAMAKGVEAIRAVEDKNHTPHHIVAVQGTEGWGRLVNYYVTHPVTGDNVAYEAHPYTVQANFDATITTPAKTLPLILGEFAPAIDPSSGLNIMSQDDALALIDLADAHNMPYTAWDFHTFCNSHGTDNMLLQNNTKTCDYGTPLLPTAWGTAVQNKIKAKQ